MTTAAVVMPATRYGDDETVWDFELKVGQRVEIVGFVIRPTWLGDRLMAIIIHPETGAFADVPAYFLTPEQAAVPA